MMGNSLVAGGREQSEEGKRGLQRAREGAYHGPGRVCRSLIVGPPRSGGARTGKTVGGSFWVG